MQPIPLIKRFLFYVFLLLISSIGVLFVVFLGGRSGAGLCDIVFVFLIPHYILGAIFLKTKLIFKLIVPFTTAIVSFGSFWLIGETEFFNETNSDILFYFALVSPIVLVWEIAYQILIRCFKFQDTVNNTEKSNEPQ